MTLIVVQLILLGLLSGLTVANVRMLRRGRRFLADVRAERATLEGVVQRLEVSAETQRGLVVWLIALAWLARRP